MYLLAETFQKTLLVLYSDGFQGRWRKEVSEALLDGIRKRLGSMQVPSDTPQPEIPGMPRNGANGETVHRARQKFTGRKEYSDVTLATVTSH